MSNPLPEATVITIGPGAPDKEGRVMPTAMKVGNPVLLLGWGGNAIRVREEVQAYFLFTWVHGGADAFFFLFF